ncbi:uncharacterized protein B0H18DRAFT_274670 [Fomitopsis serialis]|uniref:uncharacterized protein n=1 Tax=Fomitopsis serialis TaxID=139415 RepID=UPI0020079396|nr:uncharacterized protein B0H18DRAFT_274670 [Neoantrodia serialis]KAH9927842.1 hypothetical protein B0H18DRAFT_274670 [Neoantrodia serialis]
METLFTFRFFCGSKPVRTLTLTSSISWIDVDKWLWSVYDTPTNGAALQYLGHDGRQVVVGDDEELGALLAMVSSAQSVECRVRNRHVNVVDQAIARTSDESVDDSTVDPIGDRIVKIAISQRCPPAFLTDESPVDVQRRSTTPPPPYESDSGLPDAAEAQFARRMVAEPYSLFAHGEGLWIDEAPLRLGRAQLLRGPNGAAVALDLTRALRSGTVIDIEDGGGIGLDRSSVQADDHHRSHSPHPPPAYGMHVHDILLMTASPPASPPLPVSHQVPTTEEPSPNIR